ncbi:MAG: hypothetical protein JW807_04070 [Spirochaetes bacterium]|nr:hypothetical protein [Spirochaetota bacterium]
MMGTIIRATSISLGSNSSIDLAVSAGQECIAKSKTNKKDIDLLLNVGLYRDDNIMEPAIAPLLQQKLDLNIDPVHNSMENGALRTTFSLDVANSTCGFLHAAHVADSLIKTGMANNVLIVSSDVHPSKKTNPGFPYNHIGAAVLLSGSDDTEKGFRKFVFKSSFKDMEGAGALCFGSLSKFGTTGRDYFEFDIHPDYPEQMLEYAGKLAKNFIEPSNMSPAEINHVVANECRQDFGKRMVELIGLSEHATAPDIFGKYGNGCTSSLIIGYSMLQNGDNLRDGDSVLFVGAGSGPVGACALYTV